MQEKHWYLITGIIIGWIFKIPFLIKWYKDLKKTRAYEEMKNIEHVEELKLRIEKFKKEGTWPSKSTI
jgi:hypothetical protein